MYKIKGELKLKKLLIAILSLVFALSLLCGCNPDAGGAEQPIDPLSAGGFVQNKIGDFSKYENTSAYRKVSTPEEFLQAIVDAKYHYKNVWDENKNTYTQEPADGYTKDNFKGTVHVIEIENDLNLGYYQLSETAKNIGKTATESAIVSDYASKYSNLRAWLTHSEMMLENGISQIKVENTSNLLIYSKNGVKLTHCGFKVTSDNNVVFRNLEFDEMWQWEDAPTKDSGKIGDYDWYGWAYFKVAYCGYIWIDHCTFGKSYDGQIDYSNTNYTANKTVAAFAPYGADGGNGLHISWCNFSAGSDDPDGYIYKMMSAIEEEYQEYKAGTVTEPNYLYYNALRDAGASFNDILYGLAIPQKKAFLCGDSGGENAYEYNLTLKISFAHCTFKNIEDRIPKLRGGNAVMYNCVVDNTQYYTYRTRLRSLGAASAVSAVNSGWKCALTSQGIVCGNGGSFYGENNIYRGIENLLKNNDSGNSPEKDGGYQLVNCSYDKTGTGTPFVGSSSDAGNKFSNSSSSILKPENFSWHTPNGVQPFKIPDIGIEALEELEEYLATHKLGAGANEGFEFSLLKSKY